MNDLQHRPDPDPIDVPLHEEDTAQEAQPKSTIQAGLGEVSISAVLTADSYDTNDTLSVTDDLKQDRQLPTSDQIPSLLSRLEVIASMHQHKYDDNNTVRTKAKEAESYEPGIRTSTQKQLLADREAMKGFAYSTLHEFVYTPEELHELVTKLQRLSQKNRPDFDEIEGQVIDIVIAEVVRDRNGVPANIRGVADRARQDAPGRRGMQWGTFVKFAHFASDVIRSHMSKSEEREDYLITVRDPEAKKTPDLTAVYQFVADAYTYDIMNRRMAAVSELRRDAFVTNCQVINEWYEEVAPVLSRLPRTIKVDRFGAAAQIRMLVETMNARLSGEVSSGVRKDYKLDPAGAISLQKRIGHTVENIKAELEALAENRFDEDEIVPLDFDE